VNVALSELSDVARAISYQDFVRPLAYPFDLVVGSEYSVLGVVSRKGTIWLYVARADVARELILAPAALFSFGWSALPRGWQIRVTAEDDVQILPAVLAGIDGWYERYVDDDQSVHHTVHALLTSSYD
jgi:hypothetical protein